MPCTPSASTRLACSRHHASAASEVKSTGEPLPIHHFDTHGSPSGPAHEVPAARALLVVGRRRAVQARRLRVGRDLAAVGVEVDPRGHPHHRAHPVRAHPPDQPGRVGELVRVELPAVVLRRPRRVEHDRVERNVMFRIALEVGLDVALVLVDVARSSSARRPTRAALPAASPTRAGTRAAAPPACCRRTGAAAAARRPPARRSRPRRRARSARRARPSRATPPSRARRSPTAPARSRPAGCRPGRACRPGSPARCSGGPRRATPSGRPDRRAARGARRARSRAAPRAPATRAPSRRTGRSPGVGPGSQRSSSTTWSGPGCVTSSSAPTASRSSGSPTASPAITPSVHCTKWSWISPSRTRGSIGPSRRRPSRRMVTRCAATVDRRAVGIAESLAPQPRTPRSVHRTITRC